MKKLFAILMALLMVLSLAACGASEPAPAPEADAPAADAPAAEAPAADEEIVIGLTLMDYNFPFFQDMLASAKKTAEENGAKIVDLDGRGDVQAQLQGVEDMIAASDIDALFLNPVDSDAIGPATLEANDAGIPVVTVDVRSTMGETVAHVASNNLEIGRVAGRRAVELLEAKYGEVKGTCIVMGFPQITSMKDRADGFVEIMKEYPNVTIVEIAPTNLNILEAQALWEDTMQSYPEGSFDIVYGSNATNASGMIAATEAAGRTDFYGIGVDNDDIILKAVEAEGSFMDSTVVQSPIDMGKLGVETAIKAVKGEPIEEYEIGTALLLVTKEGYADYVGTHEAEQASIAAWK